MADSVANLHDITVLIGCRDTYYYRAGARCLAAKSELFKNSIWEQLQDGSEEPSLALDDGDPATVRSAIRYCNTGSYPLRKPRRQQQQQQHHHHSHQQQQQQQQQQEQHLQIQQQLLESTSDESEEPSTPLKLQPEQQQIQQQQPQPFCTKHLFHLLKRHVNVCLFSTRYSIPDLANLVQDRLITLLTHFWDARTFVRFIAYCHRVNRLQCEQLFSVAYRMALLHWGELVNRADFREVPAPSIFWCLTAKRVVEYARLETRAKRKKGGDMGRRFKGELEEKERRIRELEEEVQRLKGVS